MFGIYLFYILCSLSVFLAGTGTVLACESCMISRLGKDGTARAETIDKEWFFEYLFEQKNYDRMDAGEAHAVHHQGHEVHDKTTEDLHHFTLGRNVTKDLTVSAEIPYVIRRFLEVDTHSIVGNKQRSEGLGDLTLIGNYRFWNAGTRSLGAVAGVKFPTGYTGEKNTIGAKFEPEFQPGSGSFDYILGGVYKAGFDRTNVSANLSYTITTRGAYDFEFGNLLTASVYADYLVNPHWKEFQARPGIDLVYHNAEKDRRDGATNADSGGQTILAGPALNIATLPGAGVYASVLFPVYQHLGGTHQHLDYEWILGCRIQY